jgi:aminoglycoside phosphotransferase (APT) family kinase protein
VSDLTERLASAGWDTHLADPWRLMLINRGFGSEVYAIPGVVVLRVARTTATGRGLDRERRLLPVLAHRLPVQVPVPVWWAEPGQAFPHGALALSWVNGTTPRRPEQAARASDLAQFMAALHTVPGEVIAHLCLPDQVMLGRQRQHDATVARQIIAARWEHDALVRFDAWLDKTLAVLDGPGFDPVLVHGDLWWGNLRTSRGRLCAVVDWTDGAVADPAIDIATQHYLGPKTYQDVVVSYLDHVRLDPDLLLRRARASFEARELSGIRSCFDAQDPEELNSELDKLRNTLGLIR